MPVALAAAEGPAASAPASSTYRLFLRDGTSVATVGEFARTGDRVVVTIGLGDRLTMTTVPAAQVDWARTDRYTQSVRAAHYAATRGEADFAAMSAIVARTLSDVAITPGRTAQLALAERARRQLADWPRDHHNYRLEEVRQTLTLLDEVIAGLRAAAGQTNFDVAFVANVLPTPPEPVLPPPTLQDTIEQALRLSQLAAPGAERTALATEARAALAFAPAAPCTAEARTQVDRVIDTERRLDRRYTALSQSTQRALDRAGFSQDVGQLLRVRARVVERDAALGRARPDAIQGLLALIDARLDAARRLQLARDQSAVAPALRRYRRDVAPWLTLFVEHRRTLDAIRALSGPSIDRLAAFNLALARLSPLLKTTRRPGGCARGPRRDARRHRPGRDGHPHARPGHRDAEPRRGLGSVRRRGGRHSNGRARHRRRCRAAAAPRPAVSGPAVRSDGVAPAPITARRTGLVRVPISRACTRRSP